MEEVDDLNSGLPNAYRSGRSIRDCCPDGVNRNYSQRLSYSVNYEHCGIVVELRACAEFVHGRKDVVDRLGPDHVPRYLGRAKLNSIRVLCLADTVETLAESEGLLAHLNAVKIRRAGLPGGRISQ